MPIHTITAEEKARLTDSACHLFIARNPKFFPCAANSEKLIQFVHSQLGMTLDEFPYPILVEQWQAAYEHIKKTSWLYERPIEEPEVDPAIGREQAAQQKVRDDFDARQVAAKRERDRNTPLSELKKIVGAQNADLRQQREQNLLPVRSTGMESRHVEQVKLGAKAQARVNVGLQNPGLDTHSVEFTRLYALELQRLRSE
jgi:hypothetical protein